ncbi:MAG: protein kinase [Rhodothermales bacterium]|nr:protein kinase [Rhodothermales bacterium]
MIGKTISHFKVLEKLGGGGMGVVYLAEDTRLKRTVALKFLPPHLSTDEESKQRFAQEAQAASALNHANICTIYDIGETEPAPGESGGQMFIAMAHYEGDTLKERLERGALPSEEALDICAQVADGLAAAHEKGIIHRDIKPANILITDRGRAVILDFGLAKLTGSLDLTKSGSTLGTAYYMSPEQVRGEPADHRTDTWSLGVVLYEMLAGRRPFVGDYEQAISYAILNSEPEPLPSSVAHLEDFVRSCLQKEPGGRVQDIADLAGQLSGYRRRGTAEFTSLPASMNGSLRRAASAPRKMRIGVLAVILGAVLSFFFAALIVTRYLFPNESGAVEPIRLVVLPFQNLGPSDEDYFADGLTEELSARLGSIDALAVIAQSSANRLKDSGKSIEEIGNELKVDYILEGTVRWESRDNNSTVRITPKLIRVDDDTQVWSETYQRQVEGIFEIQEDVGRSVAAALNVQLLQGESEQLAERPTDDLAAYQAYLRGVGLRRTLSQEPEVAAQAFDEAVARDPNFVEAHYRRAHMYSLAVWLGLPEDQARYEPLARAALSEVSRLAPGSLQDLLARGYASYYLDVDFDRARSEFEAASTLSSGSFEVIEALGPVYRRLGLYEESARLFVRALELDPLNLAWAAEGAITYMVMKRHDDAERLLDHAVQIDPDHPGAYCWKSMNSILGWGSAQRAREAEDAASADPTIAPCWYANLAVRDFGAIKDSLDKVDIAQLDRDWYGLVFPRDIGDYYFRKAIAHRFSGTRAEELAAWSRLLEVTLGDLPSEERETDRLRVTEMRALLGLALAHAGLGEKELALRELTTIRQKTRHDVHAVASRRMYIALAYTLLDERDEAISLLDEDIGGTGLTTVHWLAMPFWDSLRDEPGFQALLQKYEAS